jgi:hypothetical protein
VEQPKDHVSTCKCSQDDGRRRNPRQRGTVGRTCRLQADDRERPDWIGGKLANLPTGIAHCGICGAAVTATKRKGQPLYLCAGYKREPERGRGHASIPIDYADGQVLFRLVSQMELTNRVSFHPLPTGKDTGH